MINISSYKEYIELDGMYTQIFNTAGEPLPMPKMTIVLRQVEIDCDKSLIPHVIIGKQLSDEFGEFKNMIINDVGNGKIILRQLENDGLLTTLKSVENTGFKGFLGKFIKSYKYRVETNSVRLHDTCTYEEFCREIPLVDSSLLSLLTIKVTANELIKPSIKPN